MINLDNIKSIFGGSKLTSEDLDKLSNLFKDMSNEELLGAYKILKDDKTEILNKCKEELANRGVFL